MLKYEKSIIWNLEAIIEKIDEVKNILRKIKL